MKDLFSSVENLAPQNSFFQKVAKEGNFKGTFLLFVRSGACLPLCLKDYSEHSDVILVLSCYQTPIYEIPDNAFLLYGGLSKFHSAELFFAQFPSLTSLDAYAFFDPDVEIKFDEIVAGFKSFVSHRCAMFQFALTADSHASFDFLKIKGQNFHRTTFVEVMAPFFHGDAFARIRKSFVMSVSTWGLEYLWFDTLKFEKIGVLADFKMRHVNAVDSVGGGFYMYLNSLGVDCVAERDFLKASSVSSFYTERRLPGWVPLLGIERFLRILFYYKKYSRLIERSIKRFLGI